MNLEIFVQNLKRILDERGISYTKAGRESGAGAEFIRNIERQKSAPSIIKVQQMARYLGVTVSELLGEDASEISQGQPQPYLVFRYNQLSQKAQEEVMAFVEFKWAQEQNPSAEQENRQNVE